MTNSLAGGVPYFARALPFRFPIFGTLLARATRVRQSDGGTPPIARGFIFLLAMVQSPRYTSKEHAANRDCWENAGQRLLVFGSCPSIRAGVV